MRFVFVSALVLSATQLYGERLTLSVAPVFRATLDTMQDDFVILDMGITDTDAG
jgi:hypothetical protein